MGKSLMVVAMVGLAVLVVLPAIAVLAEGNPGQPATGEKVIVVPGASAGGGVYKTGERGQQYGAWVPPVPTPPGVLGQYSQLPCAVPYAARAGGTEAQWMYLERELKEVRGK